MKKLLLPVIFLLIVAPSIARGVITIEGTITDTISGLPISNHLVVVQIDSLNGFFHYSTVYTNANGFYQDSVFIDDPTGILMYVRTWDCNQQMHQQMVQLDPNVGSYIRNFQICNTHVICQAAFTVYPDSSALYSYHFVDQSSGNISSWYWSFGDGQSSNLQNPSHIYSQPGIYMVCLNIQGEDSTCFALTCDTILVGNPSTCYAEFSHVQPAPLMVYFNNSSVGGNGIYLWNFGDGTFSTEMSPVHIFPSSGPYIVGLSIGDSTSFCFDFTSTLVNVWDSTGGGGCHAAFRIDFDSINPTYTFHFIDESTGNIIYWNWNFGDGTNSSEQNPTHTYSQNGIYNACLTIQGADSTCSDITCKILAIGTSPACHAEFTYYNDSLNTELIIQFVDQSTAGTGYISSWYWQFGDGTTSYAQNPVHTYPSTGVYVATLTIHGADSTCFDYTSDSVFVGTGPGCHAYFSYTTDPVLGNLTLDFTDLSLGNPESWLWYFGDGTVGNVQNPVHTYTVTGTYSVCLTIEENNCGTTLCQDIVIWDSINYHQIFGQVFEGNFPLPAGMVVIMSFDTLGNHLPFVDVFPIDSNGIYYFTKVPDGNYYIMAIPFDSIGYLPTYYGNVIHWEQATLISLGTPENPYNINLVPSDQMTPGPGSASGMINMGGLKSSLMDKINMLLKDEQGKTIGFARVLTDGTFDFSSLAYGIYYLQPEMPGIRSDQVMITITAERPHAEVIMTFTGNSILGIRDPGSIVSNWSVYPNPVTDHLFVSLDIKNGTQATIGLFNMTGQMVAVNSVALNKGINQVRMSTSSLPTGIYMLRLFSNGWIDIRTKVIKTR
ncbi:MAG: PKD domain-containing protein [Bacteroidales bacterium]|jgi:PKD repeat protein|nr:PKD domain-containing protein [Bacteroidales bacterium]